jgi:hypothetical protein
VLLDRSNALDKGGFRGAVGWVGAVINAAAIEPIATNPARKYLYTFVDTQGSPFSAILRFANG